LIDSGNLDAGKRTTASPSLLAETRQSTIHQPQAIRTPNIDRASCRMEANLG
jgi:hypothetical protein